MTRFEAFSEILKEFGFKIQEYEGRNNIIYLGILNDNAIIGRERHDNDTEQDTIEKLIKCLQSYIEVMINRKMREANEQRRDKEGDSGV